MIYEVSEGKTSVRVDLQQVGEGLYDVTIDGRTLRIDAVRSGRNVYSVIEGGRQWEISVDENGSHGFDVLVAGRLFHLGAVDERRKLLAAAGQVVAEGKQTVEARMPGKIVKVSVAVGDAVREGQSLLVVEAMKMENDITSPIDGRVTEVAAREGDTVETGAHLVVVDPGGEAP